MIIFSPVMARDKTFDNVAQLEDWVNEKLVCRNKPEKASFRSEKLQVCYCNISQRNIMVDGSKKSSFLINWGFSGLYPRVFEKYALVQHFHEQDQGGKFAKELHKKLFGLKLSTNMHPLLLVAAMNEWGPFCT